MHAYQHAPELATTVGETKPDHQPDAQPRPLRAVMEGALAGGCAPARARETDEINLNSQPDPQSPIATDGDCETPVDVSQSPAIEVREGSQLAVELPQPSAWERFRTWAHPPTVKAWVPPTWNQIGWRGSVGEHVAREGWPRTGAQAWARVHQAARVVLAVVDWMLASFSRTAVVFVLYALLAHLSWLSWLPWPGFLP